MLSKFQKQQLEEWCELKCGDIIFDSTKHGWSRENNEFREKIFKKSKVASKSSKHYGRNYI